MLQKTIGKPANRLNAHTYFKSVQKSFTTRSLHFFVYVRKVLYTKKFPPTFYGEVLCYGEFFCKSFTMFAG